jgi:hypothetical protein
VFQPIVCGQTVCGTSSTYLSSAGSNTRDTDWYAFRVEQGGPVSWCVTPEFSARLFILAGECPSTSLGSLVVLANTTNCLTLTLAPGDYYAFVATDAFSGVGCSSGANSYRATLVCPSIYAPFTYQGRLDQSGSPANGLFDMRFTLHETASGGVPLLAPRVVSNIAVTEGLFSAVIDFGTAFAGARFLEVAVAPAGTTTFTTLTPRQRVTSAPRASFACTAGESQNAGFANVAGSVDWADITSIPTGFADDVDNNTPLSGNGVSGSASRSDHYHSSLENPAGTITALVVDSAGNVGIGESAPSADLEVRGNGLLGSIVVQPGGSDQVSQLVLTENTSGSFATILRMDGTAATGNFFRIRGINSGVESGDFLTISRSNGRVGIGRQSAANALEVEGNASKTAAGSWLANSDARIKTDIRPLVDALSTLDKVSLVSFRYSPEYARAHPSIDNRRYVNVIAQQFASVFPDWVRPSGETLADGSGILQVDTYPLTIYSAAAVQELHAKVKGLEARNADLLARIERLEAVLNTPKGK